MGGCFTYFSDDSGKSWRRSTGSIMVWPLPNEGIGGFGATYEPVLAELKDGRLLMFMRTNVGRIYQSLSEDRGENWSLGTPTELASGDVPSWLGRLQTSRDLLVIWNQASREEIERGYSRGRLSVALSRDEAKSWQNFKTVVCSPGLDPLAKVKLSPVAHVRARDEVGVLPDGYSYHHYPTLAFVQAKACLFYNSGGMTDNGSLRAWNPTLKVVSEKSLYA